MVVGMASAEVCVNHSWQQTGSKACEVRREGRGLSALAEGVAKAELGEDERSRTELVQQMRDWVLKNSGLINVRTDDSFLLRFLRFKKWNVANAEHTLVKYLNFRQSVPQYLLNLDCDEAKVAELLHAGYLFVSPNRDSHGKRVIIGRACMLDVNKFTNVQMSKAHAITYETLLEDEENQVVGFQHVGDLSGQTLGHLALFNPVEFHMCMRIGEQAYPMRHKGIHFIHMNNAFRYAYDFFNSRFTDKLRDRLMVHSTLEELHQHVDRRCLPKEYGGDMNMSDMITGWLKEVREHRQVVVGLDRMKSNIPIRRRNPNNNSEIEEIRGSFKKLEVD